MLGELFRGCGPGRLVSCGMCSVLPQCANLGGTRGGCCGCLKESAKAGELSHPQTFADQREHHALRLVAHSGIQVLTCTAAVHSVYRSARGHGPGRFPQHRSSDNYRNNFRALGPIMNGARIIDEPRPTPKPPITSVTQWTPRYRRVTQINTMKVSAAAHSR